MIDKDRLIQNQIKNFIMDSVKKEINIFYDNLNKFLELYESKNYTEAKVCLDEMRFSTLNLFKAMDLFNPELFSSCIFISYDDPEQYKSQIITLIIDNCVDSIKNNLDIFNEPFCPDYYYLNRKYIDQREQEPNMENVLFYNRCIFTFISEAKNLCNRHLLLMD